MLPDSLASLYACGDDTRRSATSVAGGDGLSLRSNAAPPQRPRWVYKGAVGQSGGVVPKMTGADQRNPSHVLPPSVGVDDTYSHRDRR